MNASATTLFSTLGGTATEVFDDDPTVRVASDFRTTPLQSSTITGIRATVSNTDFVDHTFRASLYSDAAGSVGSLVAAFSSILLPAESAGENLLTFSHAGISLAADTTYWLVLETLEGEYDTNAVSWWGVDAAAADAGSPFATVNSTDVLRSDIGNPNWAPFLPGLITNLDFDLIGTLDGVPEPSRAMLAGLGCALLLMRRRRC